MTDTTPRAGVPLLAAAQAQKHVTHNEALLEIDALLCARILDRTLSAPPASPADGDTYLVKATGTGLWAGQDGKIAYAIDGGWRFYAPFTGLSAYVVAETVMLVYTGAAWVDWASVLNLQNVPLLGVNTTADATNKLAVKSSALLFDNIGGGVQVKLNKNAAADTASFLFQTNYSGRAEIGLTGDDKFHFKVSPDGSAWTEALAIDSATGNIGIGTASPSAMLEMPAYNLTQNNARFGAFGIQATGATNGFMQCNSYWDGTALRYLANGAVAMFQFLAGDILFNSAPNGTAGGIAALATNIAIKNNGRLGIATSSPTGLLDVNDDHVRVRTAKTPASATATGNAGDICWDANYVYVCVAANTWKRAALSSW